MITILQGECEIRFRTLHNCFYTSILMLFTFEMTKKYKSVLSICF